MIESRQRACIVLVADEEKAHGAEAGRVEHAAQKAAIFRGHHTIVAESMPPSE